MNANAPVSSYHLKQRFKKVKTANDVPEGSHFAVMIYGEMTVHTDGDARSQSCPGHGYPATSNTYTTVDHLVTHDEALWKQLLTVLAEEKANRKYGSDRESFAGLRVEGKATITVGIEVR